MQKHWTEIGRGMCRKLWLGAALAAVLTALAPLARAADDTARFYGQWKGAVLINGKAASIISLHDAGGYTNYLVTPTGFMFAGSGAFSAVNGRWTSDAPAPANGGTYKFNNNSLVVCTNSAGQTVNWIRDSTPLPNNLARAAQPGAQAPATQGPGSDFVIGAQAGDDTPRFTGQWKTTVPMNGQMVTVISVHDAHNYTNYVLTPNGFVPAVTGRFTAANGKYLAASASGNLTGGYRFLNNDSVILTNASGQPFTWLRDNTSLPGVTPPPSEPQVDVPTAQPTVPDIGAGGRTSQNRGFEDDAPGAPSDLPPGSSYALVIGINDYTAPLPKLKTAVNDAKSMADLLSRQYGFQVTSLLNQDATRDNIFKAITHFRKSLAENDDFLIYYAGHGSYDRDTQKGYWLPVDADPDPLVTSRNISSDDLITEVRGLAARHVIIISDSCFSGDLSRAAGDFSPSDGNQAYIHRMERAPSRTLMASGSDEPVSDAGSQGHSVFADLLLHALQSQSEKSFTAEDLFASIRKSVLNRSNQSPQYTALRDTIRSSANPASHASGSLDNGDFVFNRKADAGSTAAKR